MKLEIEINEGDDLTWLEVWRDHSAIVRDRAPKPKTRAMADKVLLAVVLGNTNAQKSSL